MPEISKGSFFKRKIAFYGASVTQQRNGFVDYFSKMMSAKVYKFGFGGNHLKDAGICFIDKVVKVHPDICFIDWFSTAYTGDDGNLELYIDAIAYKLQKIGCRVIFLFLPNNRNLKECDWKSFYSSAKNYLKKQELEYICIDELLSNYPITELLRDEIHSTKKGSVLFAKKIVKYLQMENTCDKAAGIMPNLYSDITVLPVKRGFSGEVILEGNCRIQGFYLQIGPWSGIVNISSDTVLLKENTWDRWCYYGRPHFSFNLPVEGRTVFSISGEVFDSSSCKDKIDFSKHRKQLIVHEIYYWGGSLKLCSKGSRADYISAMLASKVYTMHHRLKVMLGKA